MSGIWDNFDHFEKFELFAKYNGVDSLYVDYSIKEYAQMTVTVRVNAVDSNGTPLYLLPEELSGLIRLCDYTTDVPLALDTPGSDLYQLSVPSVYRSVLVEGADTLNGDEEDPLPGDIDIDTYIAASGADFDLLNISAQIDIPGTGKHYSTAQGQGTTENPECYITVRGIPNIWSVFDSLNTLNISHSDYSGETAVIYANGRNQTPVTVSLSAMDGHGNFLNLMADNFFTSDNQQYSPPRVEIINYANNDDVFNFNGDEITGGYCYTLIQNAWCKPVGYSAIEKVSASPEKGNLDIQLYVYSFEQKTNMQLAVRVYITDDKKFTTANNSTDLWTGYAPSFIDVVMIKPVDYSDIENLVVVGENSWEQTCDNFLWQSCSKSTSERINYETGIIARKHVTIKPRNTAFSFETINVSPCPHIHHPVSNSDSDSAYEMYYYPNDQTVTTYVQSILKYDAPGANTCLWGVEIPYLAEGGLWGVSSADNHSSQLATFTDSENEFIQCIDGGNYQSYYSSPKGIANSINLYCIHLRIPEIDSYEIVNWDQMINPVIANVIDDYGNGGQFKITWSANSTNCVITYA